MIPEHIVESRASNYGFVLHSPCSANLDSEFFCSDFSDSLPIRIPLPLNTAAMVNIAAREERTSSSTCTTKAISKAQESS